MKKLFLILLLFTVYCTETEDFDSKVTDTDTRKPVQEFWDSKMIALDGHKVLAKISFGHAAKYKNQQDTELDDSVYVDFYDHEGNHSSYLTSTCSR